MRLLNDLNRVKSQSLPVIIMLSLAIELQEVDLVRRQVTYTTYFIDQTKKVVEGSIRDLESDFRQTLECRTLGNRYRELLAQEAQVQQQLQILSKQIQEYQTQLPKLRQEAELKKQKASAENPLPEYDEHLADSWSSSEKTGYLIGSLVTTILGLMIFFTGDGAIGRLFGGSLFFGGGVASGLVYGHKADDSEEADEQRRLKKKAGEVKSRLDNVNQESQKEVEELRSQLLQSERQKRRLESQLEELKDLVTAAQIIHGVNQEMGDGIVYGEPELMAALDLLLERIREEETANNLNVENSGGGDAVKGLAGAAAIGLLVIGAFTGFTP